MYKFKFEPPQEHRRSLQAPKNDHIALLNTLDKCTQILREDRLWIRNQIKNNNQDVLNLFKQYSKSSQFQNLQVKLRKYVQNVKNRIKQEQLSKFRQTLHTQNAPVPIERQLPKRSTHSNSRSHIKSNQSVQLNKTTLFKHNKSQEHFNSKPSGSQQNYNYRHFQDLLKYKFNNDVIEERESQNVTSARLHRQENQQQNRALQELKCNANNYNYNFFASGKDQIKNGRYSIEVHKEPTWEFQQKAKNKLYEYQTELQNSQKEHFISEIDQGFSRIDKVYQQREESIFDKHFNESQKMSAHQEHSEPAAVDQFKNVQYSQQMRQDNQTLKFQLKQTVFNSTMNVKVAKEQHMESGEDNIFTPQDLLNQCRNFLRNREQSVKKETDNKPFQEFLKQDALKSSVIEHREVEPAECLFGRNNKVQNEVQEEEKKEEGDESYMFPEVGNSEEESVSSSVRKKDAFVYPHFETFANSSNQKFKFQKSSPQYVKPELKPLSIPKAKAQNIPQNFSIEDFIDDLMEFSEMNPFISLTSLEEYIKKHQSKQSLSQIFDKKFDSANGEQQICMTAIAEDINLAYNKQHQKSYPRTDSTINSVYDLLDIDQKGCITREQIDSFLTQIEQAEVQNFDEVSRQLLRLFEGADFTNEQRLTYWHFFIVKNSEEFEGVSKLLGEFQFQIEREQE